MIAPLIEALLVDESTRGLAAKSFAELQRKLKSFSLWSDDHVSEITQLTPQLLLDYTMSMYGDRGVSTKKSVVWSLRKLGAYLAFHDFLPEDPARALKHPKSCPRKKLPEFLTEKQMRLLLTHAASSEDRLSFVLLSLFLNTGLRPGDLEQVRLFQYFPKRGYFTGLAKGRKNKRTPLSDSLIKVIDEYLAQRDDSCEFLLVNRRGKQLRVHTMRQLVKDAASAAGLDREVTPRMLRHTFATHLTDRHGTIMCKALLGHGSHRNTRVYAHLSPRRFRQTMKNHPYNREGHRYER